MAEEDKVDALFRRAENKTTDFKDDSPQNKVFGFDLSRLTSAYLSVIFDPDFGFSDDDKGMLIRLNTAQLHLTIESLLVHLDHFDREWTNFDRNTRKRVQRLYARDEYERGTRAAAERRVAKGGALTRRDVCKLWHFAQFLNSLKVMVDKFWQNREANEAGKGQSGEANLGEKFAFKGKYQEKDNKFCDQIDKSNNSENREIFDKMDRFVSSLHLAKMNQMLGEDGTEKGIGQWLKPQRMDGESELAFRMRKMNIENDLKGLSKAKYRINEHLLFQEDMDILELNHPVIMAIDVISNFSLNSILNGLFGYSLDSQNFLFCELWFELSLLYGKIWSYFVDHIKDENLKVKMDNLWKIFGIHLKKLPDFENNQKKLERNSLKPMHDFLEVLEKNIGKKNTEKGTQRQRILVENYAALLTDSLVEDTKLRTEFKRRAGVRQRLRKMFEFAEGNLGIFEDEFWNIFNGFNKNEEQWQKEESEKETMGKRNEKRKLAEKEKREIDISKIGLFPTEMHQLGLRVFKCEQRILSYNPLKPFFQIRGGNDAETVAEKGAQSVEFCQQFVQHKEMNPKNSPSEVDSSSTKISGNEIGKSMVPLILVDDESTSEGFNCLNSEISEKFLQNFFSESNRIFWIHFFVLDKLLTKFNRLRAFFCHGFGVVSASDLKERLQWIIRENALLALENAQPQLMHFEQCNVNSQLFLLITQLGFRSETAMAEGFESRIYLPSILDEIQEFEKNCCGKTTAKKIVEMKNVVFGWLAKGGAKDFRLALCQLFHLRNFMRENAVRKKSETEIAKWWPKECDESEGTAIRESIGQMRSEQKKANFVLIKNTVEQSDWFAKSIREESGAKVKLWKHLDGDHDMFRQLLDTGRLLRPEVFHDDNLLYSYYSDVLFGACQTFQWDGLLRTDIFIFARWLDISFKNLFLFSHASAGEKRLLRAYEKEILLLTEIAYDHTFDFEFGHETLEFQIKFRLFCAETKIFLEKLANGRKMGERKGREWLERLTLILGDKKRAGKEKKTEKSKEEKKDRETDERDQEMQEQFGQWHFDTLQSLIDGNGTFKEMLREGIQSNEKAIELIVTLLNGKTNANRMMQILGITTKHTVIEEEKGERVQRGILEREEIESKKDVNAGTEMKKKVKKKKGKRNNEKATEENNTGKEIETEETQSPIKTRKETETEETQSPIKTGKETETKETQTPIKTGKETETEETQSPIKTGKETETKQMGNSRRHRKNAKKFRDLSENGRMDE
ncbi:hypothetical protein niasHT_018403 [Heterodera trifolii]|uniref:Uncharacterized protein n=1 Tax=Heterodera trifolii TaxID=157864 RepID=A0ABD2LDH8_9BILA